MLHIKSQQFGDKPKAVAGIPHVAEILHHVDAGLLVEIDRACRPCIVVQRILEVSVGYELHVQVVMEHVESLAGPVQNLNFNVHRNINDKG